MPPRLTEAVRAAVLATAGLEPLEPYPGSQVPWRCLCLKCGAETTPRLSSLRQKGGGGCRNCGVSKATATRTLSADEAKASMRAAGYEPLGLYPGSAKSPWRARHLACGSEVAPHLTTVRARLGGCVLCGHEKTRQARKLDEAEARVNMLAANFKPLEPYPGSHYPWRCLCLHCGMESTPTHKNASKRSSSGCRNCADGGFKINQPAWVYLVKRPADGVRQYGITNEPEVRLKKHHKAGFTVILELLACVDGQLAKEIEDGIKAHLKARGIGPACTRRELPSGGWTETFAGAAAPNLRPSDFAPEFRQAVSE